MSKNAAIEIILRVRPVKEVAQGFKLNKEENRVEFHIPKQKEAGFINNSQQNKSFQFNQIFDMDTKQGKVFDKVAKDVIDSAIEGYNGTIFAYGQTGSGKTFTMTGGTASHEQKGLIPRTLSYIFNECKSMNQNINVIIQYMQIYNSVGYDLLSKENYTVKRLEDLQKIEPRQNENGNLELKYLSASNPQTEEDAMNLLFIGDTNRVVCKTPKNDESTRSHCIFRIILETSKPGSDIKTVATVHLVDLSGSQRIKQTGVEGKLERQAININLGLHYLERVIVELNKKARGQNVHIPYRESLMTTVLRDSIGGNCKTRMIATVSPKVQDLLESITTCKFAMRVALIKNDLSRNETVDPAIIIARLKKENLQLKAELALLKGQDVKDELDKYDIEECHQIVDNYIQDEDPASSIILTDRLKINQCFYYFKNLCKQNGRPVLAENKFLNNESRKMEKSMMNEGDEGRHADEIKKLKLLVQQRDNEIALLVTLINKKRGDNKQTVLPVKRNFEQQNLLQSVVKQKPLVFAEEDKALSKLMQKDADQTKIQSNSSNQNTANNQKNMSNVSNIDNLDADDVARMLTNPVNLSTEQIMNEMVAFQKFRKSYRKHQAMQRNSVLLQQKMVKGKNLGTQMNEVRNQISKLKTKLQNLKRQNAVNSLVEGKEVQDPAEEEIRNRINELKERSVPIVTELKSIKAQIDSIQVLQKKLKEQLEADFHRWYLHLKNQRQNMVKNIDSQLMASRTSNIRDNEVNRHLQSFMKAREQIMKR